MKYAVAIPKNQLVIFHLKRERDRGGENNLPHIQKYPHFDPSIGAFYCHYKDIFTKT